MATELQLVQMIRLGCRMRSLLARLAADDSAASLYRRQAKECVEALDRSADWIFTGLGAAPAIWQASSLEKIVPKVVLATARTAATEEVRQRIDAIELHVLSNGPCTVSQLAAALKFSNMQIRWALANGPFRSDGAYPERYMLATRAAS